MKNNAFTLIEILVVSTIIGLLAAGAAVSYSQFSKQSRDAKRKADLENIRGALEMYRSNVNGYPVQLGNLTCSSGSLTDAGGNTYMSTIPNDMKCPAHWYGYSVTPAGCDNSSSNYCTNYILGAYLEIGGTGSCNNCNGVCNYCLGPYGQI